LPPDTSTAAPVFSFVSATVRSRLSDKQMTFTIGPVVRRRRLLVPVLLALSGLGWAAAHAFAHEAVMPEPTGGESVAHEYAAYLPTSFALCLALALPLAAGAIAGRRWQGGLGRSLWLFGLVPIIGFVGHSFAEPLAGGPAHSPSELAPIAAVGLLVQIPFAVVAVGLARRALWLAESLARALVGARAPAPARSPQGHDLAPTSLSVAFRLDLAHSQRGPPPLPA
jgi:hypothetical protein